MFLLLRFPELDSFDSYAWGFLDIPWSDIHLDMQAAVFLQGGTFNLVTKICHSRELDSFHTSSSFFFLSH